MNLAASMRDPARFSSEVLGMRLYQYQLAPLRAVAASVLDYRGHDFLLVFPRQSGKNELLAHLLAYLLNVLQRAGGNIVYAAIGDGLGRGVQRLEARLDNRLNRGKWRAGAGPTRRMLGRAAVVFLSSHPQAYSRGETAHWLLVVDELQEQDATHLEAVFEPMRAACNATALYVGTVRFSHDALWQKKQELERLEAVDGLQRVFFVRPEQVVAENRLYGRFLEEKRRRLGERHPILRSEYFLEPIDGAGGLFPPRRRQLMRGAHSRQQAPTPGRLYVATLDVGGQDEASTDPLAQLKHPGRDYTVATVFELALPDEPAAGPSYRAVDVFVDQGSRHFQRTAGRAALVDRLIGWLAHWQVMHVVADASGVGEGLVDWLQAALPGQVTAFKFTALSKAQLGSHFLAVVETGRFRYWQEAEPFSDGWWFWQQVAQCSYELPPGGSWERQLRWFVPASATVDTAGGRQKVHDDRLLSAALVALYDDLYRSGALRVGQAESVIIPPRDPLAQVHF